MPTPKQVRFHYGRLRRLRWLLIKALNAAHDDGVIDYTDNNISPCASHTETWRRVQLTTEKQLAQAMRDEIEKDQDV